MQLKFNGSLGDIREGLALLLPELGAEENPRGVEVDVEERPGGLAAGLRGGRGYIRYGRKHQFFRALGLFIERARRGGPFEIAETPRFDTLGAMFDCSRNAVLKPDSVRYFIRKMALMGLNLLMLYTEDTYEVPGEPYFGYMRGRYSQEELRALDGYARLFGVEAAPCVQTLAHLEQFLKWQAAEHLMDTPEILLAGGGETYAFIEKMLAAASAPFHSRRIHIGMDEAHALGLGRYLQLHGYEQPFGIMERHIRRVVEITEKLGLRPMMWSDMFFRMHNSGGYYNPGFEVPEETVRRVPRGVTQVYWDYYHPGEDFYVHYIRQHKRFGHTPVFAGGICTWTGTMAQNYMKTLSATTAALSACKKEGVREAVATLWNDNGGECNYLSALNGLQLWAELGWAPELDMEKLKERTAFCCGAPWEALEDLCAVDRLPGGDGALEPQNPSKFLLWQDPLLGLFDAHVEDGPALEAHYRALRGRLAAHRGEAVAPELRGLFGQVETLCAVLERKCTLGIRMKKAYDGGDRGGLSSIAREELPELEMLAETLHGLHMREWFALNKPFGWEALDIRYGGLLRRIRAAKERLEDYLGGRVAAIEELEEERLPFDGRPPGREGWVGHVNRYGRIATPNALG